MEIEGIITPTDHKDTVKVDAVEYHITNQAYWFTKSQDLFGKKVSCQFMEDTRIINHVSPAEKSSEPRYHEPNTQGLIIWQNHMGWATQIVLAWATTGNNPEEVAKKVLEITNQLYTGTERKFLP